LLDLHYTSTQGKLPIDINPISARSERKSLTGEISVNMEKKTLTATCHYKMCKEKS